MRDARLEVPLKDCPFCGGPAETDSQRTYRSIEGKLGKAVAVYCTGSCSADMTLCLADVPGSAWEDLLAALIENWNRRIPDPRIAEWEKSCTGKHGSQMQCVGSVSETKAPQRYICTHEGDICGPVPVMEPQPFGEWVAWDDVKHLFDGSRPETSAALPSSERAERYTLDALTGMTENSAGEWVRYDDLVRLARVAMTHVDAMVETARRGVVATPSRHGDLCTCEQCAINNKLSTRTYVSTSGRCTCLPAMLDPRGCEAESCPVAVEIRRAVKSTAKPECPVCFTTWGGCKHTANASPPAGVL